MKKFIGRVAFIGAFMLVLSATVFAYDTRIDNTFVKDPSRFATINTIDAAYYNPAGLVNLQDGFYFYLGNQMAFLKYTTSVMGFSQTAVTTAPVLLNPNVTLAWVSGNGAIFFNVNTVAGGGTLRYSNPYQGINFLNLTAVTGITKAVFSSSEQAYTLGVSYGLFDKKLSVAAGIRLIQNTTGIQADTVGGRAVNVGYSLTGWTPFIGINIMPTPAFNIAINFQPTIRMRGTVHDHVTNATYSSANSTVISGNSILSAGGEQDPGLLTLGLGLRVINNIEAQISFAYHFNQPNRIGANVNQTSLGIGSTTLENGYQKTEFECGIGFEYTTGLIRPSIGLWYDSGGGSSAYNLQQPYNPSLASYSIGLGISIVPNNTVKIDIGLLKAFYPTGTAGGGTVGAGGVDFMRFTKDAWLLAYGIGIHF